MSELDRADGMGAGKFEAKFETEFEAGLAREMARVAAPEGFADRVMARVAERSAAQQSGRVLAFRSRARIWMAVAAALLIAVATGGAVRVEQRVERQAELQREEQAKAAVAEQQFALAMQVTSRTLAGVQERIGRAGAKDREEGSGNRE